jgi:hypothetical protein
MAYRSKAETIAEAKRLGIDIEGMDWPTMQKVVSTALKKEALEDKAPMEIDEIKIGKKDFEEMQRRMMEPYLGKTVRISPEMRPDANRIIRYFEELDDEIEVEEKTFSAGDKSNDNLYNMHRDYTTGTYIVKGKTGRKVVAESSLPKENAQMIFRPAQDMFPVVTFQGRTGYLYKHHRFPNFQRALIESGYYEDYKDRLKEEPNVFYLTGLLCVDVSVAHAIMNDIERRERAKRSGRVIY